MKQPPEKIYIFNWLVALNYTTVHHKFIITIIIIIMMIIIMVIMIIITATIIIIIVIIVIIIIFIATIIKNFSKIYRLNITCHINKYENKNIVYHYESSVYESI